MPTIGFQLEIISDSEALLELLRCETVSDDIRYASTERQ